MLRLENMLMMGAEQIPSAVLRQQISSALDLVVQLERSHDGKRRVTAISAVGGLENGQIAIHPLFEYRLDEEGRGDYHQGVLPHDVVERARHFALDKAWTTLFASVGAKRAPC